jgi:hypothetical protein
VCRLVDWYGRDIFGVYPVAGWGRTFSCLLVWSSGCHRIFRSVWLAACGCGVEDVGLWSTHLLRCEVTEYSQHLCVSLGRVLWLWLRFTYGFCLCGSSVVIHVVLPSKHIFPQTIVKQDLIPPLHVWYIYIYCTNCIVLFSLTICLQPDGGQLNNGRNM